MNGYDIIGDIHGRVQKLHQLLAKLGYVETEGVFRHPSRMAVFVGDFIDRGPAIRQTLQVVRAMADKGAALAVLGNHEFNALRFAAQPTAKLHAGLRDTLEEFAKFPDEWQGYLEWFRSLPIHLGFGGFRVIHALWDQRLIDIVEAAQAAPAANFWENALQTESGVGEAMHLLLNGLAPSLPTGIEVQEFEGSMRSFVRVAWWKADPPYTFQRQSLPFDPTLPDIPLPPAIVELLSGYPSDSPPLFLGHYALPPDLTPWPQADNIACVDYRAAKRGPLVAYRWDGEQKLLPSNFVASKD